MFTFSGTALLVWAGVFKQIVSYYMLIDGFIGSYALYKEYSFGVLPYNASFAISIIAAISSVTAGALTLFSFQTLAPLPQ